MGQKLKLTFLNHQYFYGHGKLLLTSEYFVIDGALALGLPSYLGQSLSVRYRPSFSPKLYWKSLDSTGKIWYEGIFEFWHFDGLANELDRPLNHTDFFVQKVLRQARKQNPHFLRDDVDVFVETRLEFPLEWGLGSSSTLIYNVAQWAYVSPFELAYKSTGGSGYDIACAQANGPILFERRASGPIWKVIPFHPTFSENLYLIYLGQKQETGRAINDYKKLKAELGTEWLSKQTATFSQLTRQILMCKTLDEFEFLVSGHESLMSKALQRPTIKEEKFSDYWGAVKSLGAWGGDFALVSSHKSITETKEYFQSKGHKVCLPFHELVRRGENRVINNGIKNEEVDQINGEGARILNLNTSNHLNDYATQTQNL